VIVFSREVFVCKCSTEVARDDPSAGELARRLRFVRGRPADLSRLDPAHHDDKQLDELRARLARGDYWMLGEVDGRVATYVWLHTRERLEYPYLPGCTFLVREDTGCGYDAWTAPDARGAGLRRRAFLEELHVLRELGKKWEASFFVKHQLEGATRSLATVGIKLVPLWRVTLKTRHALTYERLAQGDETARPAHVEVPA